MESLPPNFIFVVRLGGPTHFKVRLHLEQRPWARTLERLDGRGRRLFPRTRTGLGIVIGELITHVGGVSVSVSAVELWGLGAKIQPEKYK